MKTLNSLLLCSIFIIQLHAQDIPCDGEVVELDGSSITIDTIAASDSLTSASLIKS